MAFNFRSSDREPMSEINVTPFVDVMLVLLIIFMVTAPLLTVGVQVDLPETSADTLPEDDEPLTFTINSKGEIFIQESKVEVIDLMMVLDISSSMLADDFKPNRLEVVKKTASEFVRMRDQDRICLLYTSPSPRD